MLLKLNCQASQNELMLLKTQISQLQNLLHEKEDLIEKVKNNKGFSENFSGNNLIANLKSAKSNLTKELESKNSSLVKLKKNSKSTANNEIEIELSVYKEEFERLKTMLSDLESSPTFLETLENENHKKAIIIEQLKKDNQEIISKQKEEISFQKASTAKQIRNSKKEAEDARKAAEEEKRARMRAELEKKIQEELKIKEEKELDISRMEQEEMELIERLQNSQMMQKSAFEELELALSGKIDPEVLLSEKPSIDQSG
mgnify:CR=1 FL=1